MPPHDFLVRDTRVVPCEDLLGEGEVLSVLLVPPRARGGEWGAKEPRQARPQTEWMYGVSAGFRDHRVRLLTGEHTPEQGRLACLFASQC
jgi:hypothetical protein